MTRKDLLERIVQRGKDLADYQKQMAWDELMDSLERMSAPEARTPKFQELAKTIWLAQFRASHP